MGVVMKGEGGAWRSRTAVDLHPVLSRSLSAIFPPRSQDEAPQELLSPQFLWDKVDNRGLASCLNHALLGGCTHYERRGFPSKE